MSQAIQAEAKTASPVEAELSTTRSSPGWTMAWCGAAALLLLGSGMYRSLQASKYQDEKSYSVEAPFHLNTMPRTLGDWRIVEGGEVNLDPLTTRITGSTDHILWTYANDLTGVKLSLLLLFGPAEPVLPHNPQVCYPATGFAAMGPIIDKLIPLENHEPMLFRSAVYAKPGGRTLGRTMVYHSYLFNGAWMPEVDIRRLPRRSPGIYKVQIQRSATDIERRDGDEPIENFIQRLVPVLDQKIADSVKNQTESLTQR